MKKAATHPTGNGHINRYEYTKKPRYIKSRAVKMLESMAMDAARLRLPDVPYLAPRTFRDDSANTLTKCIIEFLKLNDWQAERINTMGRPVDRSKTFTDVLGNRRTIGRVEWTHGTTTRGSSDISATIAGRSVKVEVKFGADRQSEAQRRYQEQVEKAGGIYYIARSFAGFLDWYKMTFEK